jgi:phospholipid/cholesterol/gamma-HCH transport system substrate-binding protein
MKFRIRLANQIVGLFILLAIVGLVAALIMLGLNQRWFSEKHLLISRFKSGSALRVGMAVTLRGFEIGKVGKKALDPEKLEVKIEFQIYDEFYDQVVLENSVIELSVNPLGGSALLFHPGKIQGAPRPPLKEGSFIHSLDFDEGKELVRKGLVDKSGGDDTISTLLSQIGPVLDNVNEALYNAKQLILTVEEGIRGDRSTQLGVMLYNVNSIMDSIDEIISGRDTGPIGTSLSNVSKTTETLDESINSITKSIDETMREVSALVKDLEETFYRDIKKITANLEEMTSDPDGLVTRLIDPKGSIATLLDDNNELYNNIIKTVENVNAIVDDLEKFTEFLTSTTPQIAGILEEGRSALAEGKDVIEALKNNPLLRGGVEEEKKQPTTFSGFRDEEF